MSFSESYASDVGLKGPAWRPPTDIQPGEGGGCIVYEVTRGAVKRWRTVDGLFKINAISQPLFCADSLSSSKLYHLQGSRLSPSHPYNSIEYYKENHTNKKTNFIQLDLSGNSAPANRCNGGCDNAERTARQ